LASVMVVAPFPMSGCCGFRVFLVATRRRFPASGEVLV
jgi:hypothetical protein